MFLTKEEIEKQAVEEYKKNTFKGRDKKIFLDEKTKEILEKYIKRELKTKEVLLVLGISKASFFRMLKEYKGHQVEEPKELKEIHEIISIKEENGEQLVSARELHEFLESKQEFINWFKNRIEKYGFLENEDFMTILSKSGGRPQTNYILKLDMAKELSMVEANEKGSQARRYFIACEKKLKTQMLVPTNFKEALLLAVQQQEIIEKLQNENNAKDQIILEHTPKIEYVDKILSDDKSLLTITQIAKDYGISGSVLNNLLHENRVQYKQNGTWLLYTNYANKGYTKSQTWNNGDKTGLHTKWTQKGRLFIHELLNKNSIIAIEDKEVI